MQRRIFLTAERGKFLQLAALLRIQSCGHFYNHPREQISAAAALQVRNSLAPQLEHLAASAAGWTIDRAGAGLGAAAVALIAGVELANFDFFLGAKCGFLQRDLHIVTQIGTPLPLFRATAATTTKKTLENSAATAAEDLTENIERIVEPTTEPGGALRKSGVSISIIRGTLIDVDQDIVGLA